MTKHRRALDVVAPIAAAAVAARILVDVAHVLTASDTALARRLPDDAWYYLGIARNLGNGAGPTFDGVHRTNGFQPLWQAIEALLATITDGTALVRLSLLTGMAMVVIAALVAARAARLSTAATTWILVVLASPPVWQRIIDGMESPAVMLTLALLMWALAHWSERPTVGAAALTGLATAGCGLARVSTIPVLVLVPLVMWWWNRRAAATASATATATATAWAATATAPIAAWMAWSAATVGTVVPQGGVLKARWSRAAVGDPWTATSLRKAVAALSEEAWRQVQAIVPIGEPPTWIRRAVIATVVILIARGLWSLRRRRPAILVVLVAPLVVLLRFVLEALAQPAQIAGWYGAGLHLATAVVVAVLLTGATTRALAGISIRRGRRHTRLPADAAPAAALAVVATLALLAPSGRPSGNWGVANREAAFAARRFGPASRVGAFDAGAIGWFDPGAVNLDGLVREPRFVRFSADSTALALLRHSRVTILVGRMTDEDPRVPGCARRVWSSPTDVEIAGETLPVSIWLLDRC